MNIPMEIGSLLGVIVLAGLVLAVAFVMPYAIGRNLVSGHKYREQLDEALSQLRISNMLGFLGIDKDEYLHKQHSVEVQKHMTKCDACEDKELSDDTLTGVRQPQTDLSFCANIEELEEIADQQRKEPEPQI